MPSTDTRRQLLERAIEEVARGGFSERSLRSLAGALHTSHRMLIHHFGSREGLLVEIIHAVEQRQREVLAEILPDAAEPLGDAMRKWWKHISDPALWPNERLFFEVYGQALHGRQPAVQLLDRVVEDWLDPIAELSIARGVPAALARAHARLGIAVTRGLLLDLLATEDVRGVDAAMDAFIELYEGWAVQAGATPVPASASRSR